MASESSSLSQSSHTAKDDEFEGLEVVEFDANALWELLHDEPGEEKVESGGGAPMQTVEAVWPNPDLLVESYWCIDDVNKDDKVQDFNWFHIMEETYTPCNDMGGWYEGACMEEMNEILEVGDYSFSHNAVMSDEIGYIGLWQDI